MAESSLKERLLGHSKAFDGLLSLIPAKLYYGEDNSDQWQRKKQTKEEAAAARRGKLDPDSELNRNAKEVLDERAAVKRKILDMVQVESDENGTPLPNGDHIIEQPGEGLRRGEHKNSAKKQKKNIEEANGSSLVELSALSRREAKRVAKREKKVERRHAKKAAQEAPPDPSQDPESCPSKDLTVTSSIRKQDLVPPRHPEKKEADGQDEIAGQKQSEREKRKQHTKATSNQPSVAAAVHPVEKNGVTSASGSDTQSSTSDTSQMPTEDATSGADAASASTSLSSKLSSTEKPKQIRVPADTEALRARLAAKIATLRAARKADGPDGRPIRTRQELIEARRIKQTQRKEHKKELRRQAKLEEAKKRDETLASNSPGLMSPGVNLYETSNFSFGRVAFGDGSQMSHDLTYVLNQAKKKGPSDPKTALLKFQNQNKRLDELDAEKRADIADKETWLTARRRIEGNKIHDDEALLKKAFKRKEAAKKKSEKAWQERVKGVGEAQKERQKKREDNTRKRKETKVLGKAGKKKGALKKKAGRPGFEGSFGVGGRRK